MNQPEVQVAGGLGVCAAQRFAPALSDEVLYDVNVYEIGTRTHSAHENVGVARRVSMHNELDIWHMSPNRVEQLCGLLLWQAFHCIADFNEAHRVHPEMFKSLPNPTGYGVEFPLSISPARLDSRQANV